MKLVFIIYSAAISKRLGKISRKVQDLAYLGKPAFGHMLLPHTLPLADGRALECFKMYVNTYEFSAEEALSSVLMKYLEKTRTGSATFFDMDGVELGRVNLTLSKSKLRVEVEGLSKEIFIANKKISNTFCELPMKGSPLALAPKELRESFSILTAKEAIPVVRMADSGGDYLVKDREGHQYGMKWVNDGWKIVELGPKNPKMWSSSENSATYVAALVLSELLELGLDISLLVEITEAKNIVVRKHYLTSFGIIKMHTRRRKPGETEILLDFPNEDGFRFYPNGFDRLGTSEYQRVSKLIF